MSEDFENLGAQIAYVKQVATEGRQAALVGGSILLVAGNLFAAASLASALLVGGARNPPSWWLPALWAAAAAAVWVFSTYRRRMLGGVGRYEEATNNRAVRAAWTGSGLAICAIGTAYALTSWRTQVDVLFTTFPSVVFAAYGAAWFVASAVSNLKSVLSSVAWLSFATSALLAFSPNAAVSFLAQAFAFLVLVSAPGWVLIRREHKPL